MNEFLQELQEIYDLQAKLEAKLKRLQKLVSSNKASKEERRQYKSLKGQVNTLLQKTKSVKAATTQIKRVAMPKVKKVKVSKVKEVVPVKATTMSGPFDSYGYEKGYFRAAQAAGNRIERAHPGFFERINRLGKEKAVDILWRYYGEYHRADNFYEEHGNEYVDEYLYDNLLVVLQFYEGVPEGEIKW